MSVGASPSEGPLGPGRRFGDYEILAELGAGGMGRVYRARDLTLERLVALKTLAAQFGGDPAFVHRFLKEARAAARLNHPNIVQIFNLGAQDDSYFIAMEYIHGEDVRRVWKRSNQMGRVMPVPLVCRVIMEACAGLDYAHKKVDASGKPLNIVHRDISPQNILVTF
ncbi:MAG TPA: protein kinase, partial [Vicinamibacteria bacterium]|nr:protein kinase [Vicinamibacteria bacterium]